jgi:hypothetical protein
MVETWLRSVRRAVMKLHLQCALVQGLQKASCWMEAELWMQFCLLCLVKNFMLAYMLAMLHWCSLALPAAHVFDAMDHSGLICLF